MEPIRIVLFPTDFSAYSDAAFHFACSLAAHYQAKLSIVHVHEPPFSVGELVMPLIPDDETERAKLREKLSHVRPSNPSFSVEHHLLSGPAADEIIRASEELTADIIVMGTHGRRGLSRALMGSVAAKVARRAKCPVVAIKLPRKDVAKKSKGRLKGASSLNAVQPSPDKAISQQLLAEHEMLAHDADAVRTILDWMDHDYNLSRKLSSLRFAAGSLRDHLERLLTLEEQEGYLDAFTHLQPPLQGEAARLHDDHVLLCKSLVELVSRAKDLLPTDHAGYAGICEELSELLGQIDRHCNQETDLLEKALL